jgi:hypothetical protein
MRCCCCNRNLSDYESTLKHPETKEYLDICRKCLVDIPVVPVPGNIAEEEDVILDEFEDEEDTPLEEDEDE